MATTINIFSFALFEKERSEVLGGEGFCLFVCFLLFSTTFKNSSQGPAASTGIIVLPRIKEKKRKISAVCGFLHGFLAESWQVLDSFWLFATTSCLFLTDFFFFLQESASLLKNHQEANKKTSRSCWDAAKKHEDMSRSVTKCQKEEEVSIFLKISKKSWSFPIDQEYWHDWRSAKKLSRSLQDVIKNDQELKFGTILVQIREGGTAPRCTTRI